MKVLNCKQLLHWGGLGIGIIGVAFIARKLAEYSNKIDLSGLSYLSLFALSGLITACCCANFLLAFAWRDLLKHLGVETTRRRAVQTYGISQIAKYVPGNIFHFAGRQAIGQAASLPVIPLAKSSLWELGLIAVTGTFFSVLVLPLFWNQITFPLALILFIILFLILSGIIFNGVLMVVTSVKPEINAVFIGIAGVYVVSWLAGLLTPGAPAGIGLREMVFLAILHAVVSEGELLKTIVFSRVVTVGGDILFYIFSVALRFRKAGQQAL